MGWTQPFKNYADMLDYVGEGRSPRDKGRKYTSAFRLYLRDDHIEIRNHNLTIAKLRPDDTLEFVATRGQVWSAGSSLSMNMRKLVPVEFLNFSTGKYKVMHRSMFNNLPSCGGYTREEYDDRHNAWLELRRGAQEYFQGLILNLKTGEVINPKDMTPVTDESKRKQWLAGLKSFRFRLRAMARVGALDVYNTGPNYHAYFSTEDMNTLAEAIMSGEVSPDVAKVLAVNTSRWTLKKYSSFGEAVVGVFENTVKSNSRQLRTHVGVITLKD